MKLKCIKNKIPHSFLSDDDYSDKVTVGKIYTGQIHTESDYFVFYADNGKWETLELSIFAPVEEML